MARLIVTARRAAACIALGALTPALALAQGPVAVELPPSAPAQPAPAPAPSPLVTSGTDPESAAINEAEQQKAVTRVQALEAERDARARDLAEKSRAYDEALAARDAEAARVAADNAAARAQWEADTAACLAGEKTRCAAVKVVTPKR